jgi:hypothetical protein
MIKIRIYIFIVKTLKFLKSLVELLCLHKEIRRWTSIFLKFATQALNICYYLLGLEIISGLIIRMVKCNYFFECGAWYNIQWIVTKKKINILLLWNKIDMDFICYVLSRTAQRILCEIYLFIYLFIE